MRSNTYDIAAFLAGNPSTAGALSHRRLPQPHVPCVGGTGATGMDDSQAILLNGLLLQQQQQQRQQHIEAMQEQQKILLAQKLAALSSCGGLGSQQSPPPPPPSLTPATTPHHHVPSADTVLRLLRQKQQLETIQTLQSLAAASGDGTNPLAFLTGSLQGAHSHRLALDASSSNGFGAATDPIVDPSHVNSFLQSPQAGAVSAASTMALPGPAGCGTPLLSGNVVSLPLPPDHRRRKGRTGAFPQKLHQMLSDLEGQEGGCDIASFLHHGRAFAIHKPREFVKQVMPKYFRMSRFSSFQRQLNLYDFQRITEGSDKGAYYHELFVQGRPILSSMMKRNKIKGVKNLQQHQHQYMKFDGGDHSTDYADEEEEEEVSNT